MPDITENTPVTTEKPKKPLPWITIGILCSAFSVVVLLLAGSYSYRHLLAAHLQISVLTAQLEKKIEQLQSDVLTAQQTGLQLTTEVNRLAQTVTRLEQSRPDHQERVAMAEASYLAKIYLKVKALDQRLDTLPLPSKSIRPSEKKSTADNIPESWWHRGLHASWAALQNIVIVRYHENETPSLTPDERMFVSQQLHALMTQTIWGLLNRQPVVYHTGLEQVSALIRQYYAMDALVTQALLNELRSLEKIDIQAPVPPSMAAWRTLQTQEDSA